MSLAPVIVIGYSTLDTGLSLQNDARKPQQPGWPMLRRLTPLSGRLEHVVALNLTHGTLWRHQGPETGAACWEWLHDQHTPTTAPGRILGLQPEAAYHMARVAACQAGVSTNVRGYRLEDVLQTLLPVASWLSRVGWLDMLRHVPTSAEQPPLTLPKNYRPYDDAELDLALLLECLQRWQLLHPAPTASDTLLAKLREQGVLPQPHLEQAEDDGPESEDDDA